MAGSLFLKGAEISRFAFEIFGVLTKAHLMTSNDRSTRVSAAANVFFESGIVLLQVAQRYIDDTDTFLTLKGIEMITRMVDAAFTRVPDDRVWNESFCMTATLGRNIYEVKLHGLERLLQMRPEEFAKLELPVLDDSHRVIGSYHPTREELEKEKNEALQCYLPFFVLVELGCRVHKSVKEWRDVWTRVPPELAPAVVLPPQIHQQVDMEMDPYDPFNLSLCRVIPDALVNDRIFAAHICPISGRPIRFAVQDRRHLEHVYERSAITERLNHNPTSPVTGEPMSLDDLQPCPEIQDQINHQLTVYVQLMRDFVHERLHQQ